MLIFYAETQNFGVFLSICGAGLGRRKGLQKMICSDNRYGMVEGYQRVSIKVFPLQ